MIGFHNAPIRKALCGAIASTLVACVCVPIIRAQDEPLPKQALKRFGTTRLREAWLTWLDCSPDGKHVATGGSGNAIVLWDVHSGRQVRRLLGHPVFARCGAFSADGSRLASADGDGNVLHWNVATGAIVRQLVAKHHPEVIALSPNGKLLACGGLNNLFHLWDVDSGELLFKRPAKPGQHVYGLKFTSDGALLAISNSNDAIELLDPERRTVALTLPGAGHRCAFSADGKRLVSINDGAMDCWDVATGRRLFQCPHDSPPSGMAVHPNGKIAVTGSTRGTFQVWDLDNGTKLRTCPTQQHEVLSLAFAPDGSRLLTQSTFALDVWDTSSWERVGQIDGPTLPATRIAFAANGTQLVALHGWSSYAQVHRWDIDSGTPLPGLKDSNGPFYRQDLSSDGRWLAGWSDGISKKQKEIAFPIWNCEKGCEEHTLPFKGALHEIALSANNHKLAADCGDHFAFCDLATGVRFAAFTSGKMPARRLALSPRASWLASADSSGAIIIWDVGLGVPVQEFGRALCSNRLLAFAPDGSTLADALLEYRQTHPIDVWEPLSGQKRLRCAGFDKPVTTLAFSPDGRMLASGHAEGAVRLWSLVTGKELAVLEGQRGHATALAFSPDSRTLASGCMDTTIVLWRIDAEKIGGAAPTPAALEKCWNDLAADGPDGHTALWLCARHPEAALPFLKENLKSHPVAQLERVSQWLTDLDDAKFAVRERAVESLVQAGPFVRSALNETLLAPPSLEVKLRVQKILDRLRQPRLGPDDFRIYRVAEALRHMGDVDLGGLKHLRSLLPR